MDVEFESGTIISYDQFLSIHRDGQSGIYTKNRCVISIRFQLGEDSPYPDRWIKEGEILDYTGQGSAKNGNQKWNRYNLPMRIAYEEGHTIKVFERLPNTTPRKYRFHGDWFVTNIREVYVKDEKRKVFRFTISAPETENSRSQIAYVPSSPMLALDDIAADIDEPPSRTVAVTRRIIRNTSLCDKLKKAYYYSCQVCGERLLIGDEEFYIEVHHLRPLGGEHKGMDRTDNMLVLCPNHHAMFDYGAIAISPTDSITLIHVNPTAQEHQTHLNINHRISFSNIEYHYNYIFKGAR